MKKYSTSEAIAMLEKNPKLVFKAEVCVCGDIGTGKRVRMWVNSCHEIKIDGFSVGARHGLNTNDEWELVQLPVDFITAVKAYSEGKTIRCETGNNEPSFYSREVAISVLTGKKIYGSTCLIDNHGGTITTKEILEGTWYVEESNE